MSNKPPSHIPRMGHGNALNKMPSDEAQHWSRLLTHALPTYVEGYVDAADVGMHLMNYELLPPGIEHGKQWLNIAGMKSDTPLSGKMFMLSPIGARDDAAYEAHSEKLERILSDLHARGCHAVPYVHSYEDSGESKKQFGAFLPNAHLEYDPEWEKRGLPKSSAYSLQHDADGQAIFLAYLQDKGLVSQQQVDEVYKAGSFTNDKVLQKAAQLRQR